MQVYNNKITGIYQVATPNTESPEKITVSGKEYTIDSVYAYSKLYNSGEFEIPFNRQELADYLEVERSGLSAEISKMKKDENVADRLESGVLGIGWARSGGEATAIFNDDYLAADGIDNVIRVLDQLENGNIPHVEFVELNACTGGCVGGVLTMQNPYIAQAKLQTLRRYLPVSQNFLSKEEQPP